MKRIGKFIRIFFALFSLIIIGASCSPFLDDDLISLQVRTILELTTVSYTYKSVLYFEDVQKFLGILPISMQHLLFSVKTKVQAGIPLSEGLSLSRVNNRILLKIPEPTILLVDADEDSLFQYRVSEIGKNINWVDVGEHIAQNKQLLVNDAQDAGIIQKAKENARLQIKELMQILRIDNYSLEFVSALPPENE